ncbi:MAG: polyprenol phosphomannose-dependent alpha 1,6 mannosyltransferase MptB [Actinomycetes bacterium]
MATAEGAGHAAKLPRLAAGCIVASLALLLVVAVAGESAAVPGLGPAAAYPPWSLELGWGPGLVTVLLACAYLLGAGGVGCGLVALRHGARISPALVTVAATCVLVAVAVVPPVGSGDHLSYAAYGRIAAEGGDPYVERPTRWDGGHDPVASAVQPPWTGTRSIYGPVATALQALSAVAGNGSLRLTVWVFHLLVVGAFALTAWLLDRLARDWSRGDSAADRSRVALLWTLNPLVLGPGVLGSHLDVLGVALVVVAMALMTRMPLLAGVALGGAVGVKLPFAIGAVAVLWGLRHLPWRKAVASPRRRWGRRRHHAVQMVVGAAAVLVPAHAWAGPHVYDQVERASRYVSLASPWRPIVDLLDPRYGMEAVRAAVGPGSALAAAVVAVVLSGLVRRASPAGLDDAPASVVRAMVVLAAAWLLVAPYALPWYDVLLWAPLALLGVAGTPALRHVLDGAVLARAGVLALAYVPGRVVGLSPAVEGVTLGFRSEAAPWLVIAVLVWLLVRALPVSASPRSPTARRRARAFARSPR